MELHLCFPFHFFMAAWRGTSLYNSFGHFTGLQICRQYWCCVCVVTAFAVRALLDGKRSGSLCRSQQSRNKQAEDLILKHVTVCQLVTFCHHVQKIQLLFLLHEICVLFEKEKKFLATVILNSGKYYIYKIESIGLRLRARAFMRVCVCVCVLIFTNITVGISVYKLFYLQVI